MMALSSAAAWKQLRSRMARENVNVRLLCRQL